jgi:hypothetical protein
MCLLLVALVAGNASVEMLDYFSRKISTLYMGSIKTNSFGSNYHGSFAEDRNVLQDVLPQASLIDNKLIIFEIVV